MKKNLKEFKKRLVDTMLSKTSYFKQNENDWSLFSRAGNLSVVWEYKKSGLYLNIGGTPSMLNGSDKNEWHIQIMISKGDTKLETAIENAKLQLKDNLTSISFKNGSANSSGFCVRAEKNYPLISDKPEQTINNINAKIEELYKSDWKQLIEAIVT